MIPLLEQKGNHDTNLHLLYLLQLFIVVSPLKRYHSRPFVRRSLKLVKEKAGREKFIEVLL